MPQEPTQPANPFETYSQQERDSMGTQLSTLLQSGKLTPGQMANVRKAMLLNNKASQAKGPQSKGFDEQHPFLAKDLPYESEMLKGVGRAAKTMVTAPYELLKKTTPEEKKQYPNIVEGGPVNRLANRLIREPIAQEKKAAEASRTVAAQGEGVPGQILEYYKNMPFIGGMVSKAMEGGPHMFSPQSIGATTEASAYALAPEVQKGIIQDLKVRAPRVAESLRAKSATLYTKSVKPSAELQRTISETDPTAIGKGLQAENIVTRRKTYIAKLEPIVDKNVEKLRAMEQQAEAKGYHMNAARHFDQAVAEELARTKNPQAKNTIQQFADAARYESKFDPQTNRWSIDYNKPRNLSYMTPTEVRQFMRDLDEYAYGDASSRALLEQVAKRARGAISSEFGKNIPGYTELGKQVQGQIGALDALRETHAAEVRGAKTQVMRTVFEAGVIPIATYEALRTLGASTGVSAAAYPSVLALVKAAVSTPSRTVRGLLYNKVADLIDPKGKAGVAYMNPAPPPPPAARPPGTAGQTVNVPPPTGGAPIPPPATPTGTVGGRTTYSGAATPTGEGAGSATTTGATYVKSPGSQIRDVLKRREALNPMPEEVRQQIIKTWVHNASKGIDEPWDGTGVFLKSKDPGRMSVVFDNPKEMWNFWEKGPDPKVFEPPLVVKSKPSATSHYPEATRPSEAPTPGIVTPEVQQAAATPTSETAKAAKPKASDAERAAARDAKRAKDRERMAQNRAIAKSEAQAQGMTAWEGEEGKKMRVAVSQAMGPEEHAIFMDEAIQMLKRVNPENYDLIENYLKGPDSKLIDPKTQRELVMSMIEGSMPGKPKK